MMASEPRGWFLTNHGFKPFLRNPKRAAYKMNGLLGPNGSWFVTVFFDNASPRITMAILAIIAKRSADGEREIEEASIVPTATAFKEFIGQAQSGEEVLRWLTANKFYAGNRS